MTTGNTFVPGKRLSLILRSDGSDAVQIVGRSLAYHPAIIMTHSIIIHLEGESWVFTDIKWLGRTHIIATFKEKISHGAD